MSFQVAAIVFRPEGDPLASGAVLRMAMKVPSEDIVARLLGEPPALGSSWLIMVGTVTLGMTPISLILAGIWGAVFVNGFLVVVWLASAIWVRVQRGSLAYADVLLSGAMVMAWPSIAVIGSTW